MKMSNTRQLRALTALLVVGSLGASACASLNKKEEGAVIGAATGAAVGGVIGNQTGSTARGAIIGAVVGGTAGAIIGHQMDQQAKELSQNIPGATVARVGEGIEVTFASGLLFAFDSDQILPAAGTNLRELATSLNKYPDSQLLIVGHTDNVG
ncbi:MAG TPA: glycine zipper domain-containing protein, partial [Gemmatimonadaceae bacterium]|nr:glycine zipper domain-containing protein [Gemmatimonadaceae bacterium]